jgi:uncharacterized membrane protein YphA (DoxX/SURF4 family)
VDPNPLSDGLAFLTKPVWPTAVFWALLLGSCVVAIRAWAVQPYDRSGKAIGIWLLRLTVGIMWWQQSLWKLPPNFDMLLYWMRQIVAHSWVPLQRMLVSQYVIPQIRIAGLAVYGLEVLIGAFFMLGAFTRLGAVLGLVLALNLWVGLYSAPGQWPWTFGYLIVIQALFVVDPPGRCLGLETPDR